MAGRLYQPHFPPTTTSPPQPSTPSEESLNANSKALREQRRIDSQDYTEKSHEETQKQSPRGKPTPSPTAS